MFCPYEPVSLDITIYTTHPIRESKKQSAFFCNYFWAKIIFEKNISFNFTFSFSKGHIVVTSQKTELRQFDSTSYYAAM